MPVVVKKTCDQTVVEIYTCPPLEGGGAPYIGVNVGGGVGVYKLTDQITAPREHHFYTLVGVNGTQVVRVGDQIQIEGGGSSVEFATREETDAGVLTTKALNPDVGAYAYDRFRYAGQHGAGKGTQTITLVAASQIATPNCHDSNVFRIVLTENIELGNPTNPIGGQVINVKFKQNETGNWAVTFGTKIKVVGTISAGAGTYSLLSMQYDETDDLWLGVISTGFA